MKYTCPCCGYKTFDIKPPGTVDICPVCYWQDDLHQSVTRILRVGQIFYP